MQLIYRGMEKAANENIVTSEPQSPLLHVQHVPYAYGMMFRYDTPPCSATQSLKISISTTKH